MTSLDAKLKINELAARRKTIEDIFRIGDIASLTANDIYTKLFVHERADYLDSPLIREAESINKAVSIIEQEMCSVDGIFVDSVPVHRVYTVQNPKTQPRERHKIIDIWHNNVKHKFAKEHDGTDSSDFKDATEKVKRMVGFLGADYIEDIDQKLELLDSMKKKLEDYTYRGEKLSGGTISNYYRLFRQIVRAADVNNWIENENKMLKKLTLSNDEIAEGEKERQAFDELDMEKIFTELVKIKNGDISTIQTALKTRDFKQYAKSALTRITRAADRSPFVYATVFSLFTGSRATAAITMRHQDFDLNNLTVHIHKDKALVATGDKREILKDLKTDESERHLRIPQKLIDMGFVDYLRIHEKKYGKEAFIYEEIIKTRKGYKPSYINESMNRLLDVLGIKPDANSDELKDYHSLKTTYYTWNKDNVSEDVLRAIAGNKLRKDHRDIVDNHYDKTSKQKDLIQKKMNENIDKITFPKVDILLGMCLGGKWTVAPSSASEA